MASAYTPGLLVTESVLVRKRRRLPILGEVTVKLGDVVKPHDIVARTHIPGDPDTVNVANQLGVEGDEIIEFMLKKKGDKVTKGETIAKRSSFFGLFKTSVQSTIEGTVDNVSPVTGVVTLRRPAVPVAIPAYIHGRVIEVTPREGVVVETPAALIQGIFGVGGETQGALVMLAKTNSDILSGEKIKPEHKGKVVVGGSLVTADALRKAASVGAAGIVAGGIIDTDLIEYLGHDIGVAITGAEDIPITLVLTEGFGQINMADRTFALLKSLDGKMASINGATQIRAGVMRPEIIVPLENLTKAQERNTDAGMEAGTPIRIIREPYFGKLATVHTLPPELQVIETGAKVRIMTAKLANGDIVTIPRANVELIEG
ncbi:MAG: hypothetical protein DDT35_00677 [Firmicutes bacterium]|nr:hypothetical protein [Bacillota bacterium]